MIRPDESILVAVSGGPDSIALLRVLMELSSSHRIKLGIAHLNHMIRKHSESDQKFVESVAKQVNLPFYPGIKNIPQYSRELGVSIEEAGRIARYAFFEDLLNRHGYDKIATGHNSDDNAEQVLMNLFRGAGMAGLSGIPPVRARVIRPLIQSSRRMIMEYLIQHGHSFIEDESNTDPTYMRNRIRWKILPEIEKYCNPNIANTLNRFSDLAKDEEHWINDVTEKVYSSALIKTSESEAVVSSAEIQALHPALQKRVIRKAILNVKGDLKGIEQKHVDLAINALKTGSNEINLDLPGRIRICKQENGFRIRKENQPLRQSTPSRRIPLNDPDYYYEMTGPGTLYIHEIGAFLIFRETETHCRNVCETTDEKTARLDLGQIEYPLVIRPFRPGDTFRPLGMTGTQKVNRFFSNQKTGREWRKKCPLVVDRGKIIWIAGHRIADTVKIKEDTKRILMIQLSLA